MYDSRLLLLCASILTDGNFDEMMDMFSKNISFMNDGLIKKALSIKCKYVTIIDKEYPPELRLVFKPPLVLYYYGDISLGQDFTNNVAIIGSREPSTTGVINTVAIAKHVVDNGYTIVSGLAYGVDYQAQNTAMENNGKVIAVLAGGLDHLYPKEHFRLFEKIKKNGLVLSEYPEGSEPRKERFPFRNRLIAGLSHKIIVTEAKKASGTSTTIGWTSNPFRDVLCVPGAFEEDSLCNSLIRDGCGCLGTMNDLEDELPKKDRFS